jgi:hypothetical protein
MNEAKDIIPGIENNHNINILRFNEQRGYAPLPNEYTDQDIPGERLTLRLAQHSLSMVERLEEWNSGHNLGVEGEGQVEEENCGHCFSYLIAWDIHDVLRMVPAIPSPISWDMMILAEG